MIPKFGRCRAGMNVKSAMSHGKLAEIVVEFIEFLELVDDDHLDSRTAVKQQEWIASELEGATNEERAEVMQAARARLLSLRREPDEHGYSPSELVTKEHLGTVGRHRVRGSLWVANWRCDITTRL